MARKPRKPYPPWRGAAGSGPDVWRKLAAARLGSAVAQSDDLSALGLTTLPANADELKRAYRKAMMAAHPDRGGTHEEATKITLAYTRLIERIA